MGLLRGMARTAVVAGTATAVSNRVSRRQANRWAEQDQAAYAQQGYAQQPVYVQEAPAPESAAPAASQEDVSLEQLERLAKLHDSGALTDEEFAAQKAKILGS
jgi:hypothetical protein